LWDYVMRLMNFVPEFYIGKNSIWTVITVTDPYLKIERLHSIVPRRLKLDFGVLHVH